VPMPMNFIFFKYNCTQSDLVISQQVLTDSYQINMMPITAVCVRLLSSYCTHITLQLALAYTSFGLQVLLLLNANNGHYIVSLTLLLASTVSEA